jgi:hypothetical protein
MKPYENRNLQQQQRWWTLEDMLQHSKSHESQPVPFDKRLVWCTYISFGASLVAIYLYMMNSQVSDSAEEGGCHMLMGWVIDWELDQIRQTLLPLIVINILYLLITATLFLFTHRFREGR